MSGDQGHLDRVREQFGRQADAYARTRQAADEASMALLVDLAGTQAEDRVLDVASGPGLLTMAFAQRAAGAVGLDVTPAMARRARTEARRRGIDNVAFSIGGAQRLPFTDGAFDLVSSRAAFHHFPSPSRVLAEMMRVVRPAGRLLIADLVGSEDPTTATEHDAIERLCDPSHARAIPAAEFDRLFGAQGLTTVQRHAGSLDEDVSEWLGHGGPAPAVADEIVRRLEASMDGDTTGLHVRREDGTLRFSHQIVVFVLERPA